MNSASIPRAVRRAIDLLMREEPDCVIVFFDKNPASDSEGPLIVATGTLQEKLDRLLLAVGLVARAIRERAPAPGDQVAKPRTVSETQPLDPPSAPG